MLIESLKEESSPRLNESSLSDPLNILLCQEIPQLNSPRHRLRLLLVGILLCSTFPGNSHTLLGAGETHVVKAAYFRNAFNFARWPSRAFPNKTSRFEIGYAGEDKELEQSLQLAFEKLQYRVQNRSVRLTSFDAPEALEKQLEQSPAIHALIISASEKDQLDDWMQACGNQPILLISDHPEFSEAGGHVWMTPNPKIKGRYIYNVHLPNLKSSKIRFTNEFLRLRSAVNVISN